METFGNLILKAANAAKGKRPRVAIFGEGADLLWKRGGVEIVMQDERLCNQLTKRFDVTILCGYSLSNIEGGMDDEVVPTNLCTAFSRLLPLKQRIRLAHCNSRLSTVTA